MGSTAMTSYPSRNKASRLAQIAAILLTAPDGMTQAELARRLGVNRSTVNRCIPDLPGFIYIDAHGTAEPAFGFGAALEKISPQISGHLRKTANGIDDPARKQDPGFLKAIETLTQAWATYHKVMIHYQAENDAPKAYLFSPDFIEPYAIGQSTDLIGWREPPGALRTFKVERITDIALCGETYTIPQGFEPEQFLQDAWGIWYTGEAPSPRLSRGRERGGPARPLHRMERVTEKADGSLTWTGRIAEPVEMLPWIKGWGAEVEMLEPASLQATLREETARAARVYGWRVEEREK